jgi:hypothetical protein
VNSEWLKFGGASIKGSWFVRWPIILGGVTALRVLKFAVTATLAEASTFSSVQFGK